MKLLDKKLAIMVSGLLLLSSLSCRKYLDKKADASLLIPKTVSDVQSILDNYDVMNESLAAELELNAADLYMTTPDLNGSILQESRIQYLWDNSINSTTWNQMYKTILYSNVALKTLATISDPLQQATINDVRGQALFYRSFGFYQVAQLYCRPYSNTAASDPGIPLRFDTDVTETSTRATVQQTYRQIIDDAAAAAPLLPDNPITPMRPSRPAAYALLARTYLSMRDYVNAGKYADTALSIKNALLDFNSLNAGSAQPIPPMNREVIFYSVAFDGAVSVPVGKVDSLLYKLYDNDDLRRSIYFVANVDNSQSLRASYSGEGNGSLFYGLATDELYLIRAETAARAGNKTAALLDLNTLLKARWKNSVPFPAVTAVDAADALSKVLTERRRELLFRGTRFTDVRRLNLENAGITMTKVYNGNVYTLPPNDLRSVMLIPVRVVNLSGMAQNPR